MANKSPGFKDDQQNMFQSQSADQDRVRHEPSYMTSQSHQVPYQTNQPARMQPYNYLPHQPCNQIDHHSQINVAPVMNQSISQQQVSPSIEPKMNFPLESISMLGSHQEDFKLEQI